MSQFKRCVCLKIWYHISIIYGQAGPPTLDLFNVAVLWAQFLLTLSGRQRNKAEKQFPSGIWNFPKPFLTVHDSKKYGEPFWKFPLGYWEN